MNSNLNLTTNNENLKRKRNENYSEFNMIPSKMKNNNNSLNKSSLNKNNLNNLQNFSSESLSLNKSLGVSRGKQTFFKQTGGVGGPPSMQGTNNTTLNSNLKRNKSSSNINSNLINKKTQSASSTRKNYQATQNNIQNFNNINICSPKLEYRIPPSDEKQHIVRTIYLPNEETDTSLREENEFLKKQLNEMRVLYENQILKMEEDRRLREEEMRLRDLNFREKIEDLTKKNQKLDKLNYESTKDFMQLKYDSSNNERKLYEELEMVKLQNEALSVSVKELINKTNSDKEVNKNDYERKTREITNVMRNQVKTQEENNNIIKEQYKQIQKIYTNRVKELEEKLKSLTDKYKNLENKRNFEFEGYINEINLMRKRMRSYEDYVAKLRAAVNNKGGIENLDDDEAERILQEMGRTKVIKFI